MTDLAQRVKEIERVTSGLLTVEMTASALGISSKACSTLASHGDLPSLFVLGQYLIPIEALVGLPAARKPRAARFLPPAERAQLPSRPAAITRRASTAPELTAGQ